MEILANIVTGRELLRIDAIGWIQHYDKFKRGQLASWDEPKRPKNRDSLQGWALRGVGTWTRPASIAGSGLGCLQPHTGRILRRWACIEQLMNYF